MAKAPLIDTTQLRLVPNAVIRAYRLNTTIQIPFFDKEDSSTPIGYTIVTDLEGRISKNGNGTGSSVSITNVCVHEDAKIVCKSKLLGTVIKQFNILTNDSTQVIHKDVAFTVATKSAISSLDTSEGDIIYVLADETHNGAEAYYKIIDEYGTSRLIGCVGPFEQLVSNREETNSIPTDAVVGLYSPTEGLKKVNALRLAGGIGEAPENGKQYARKDRTWVEVQSGGGGGTVVASCIYPTVNDMKSADLNVGVVVETAGFYSAGDYGGCKYVISNSLTANDMDIIALSNGKFAKAIIGDTAYPQQIGYKLGTTSVSFDLSIYLSRLQSIGCRNIRLSPTASGSTSTSIRYVIRSTYTMTADVHLIGSYDTASGYATTIMYEPTTLASNDGENIMIQTNYRSNRIEGVVLMHQQGRESTPDFRNTIAINLSATSTDNKEYQMERMAIQGFKYGVKCTGSLKWHCDFKHIQFSLNDCNVDIDSLSYVTRFSNCYFAAKNSYNVVLRCPQSTIFENCNFGVAQDCDSCINFKTWSRDRTGILNQPTQLDVTGCNFELEGSPLPENNKHLFINVEDNYQQLYCTFKNSFFIVTPLARNNKYGNRCVTANGSHMRFIDCSCARSDVKQTNNTFYELDFDKLFFNENSAPAYDVASLVIEHCIGISFPVWASDVLPSSLDGYSNVVKFDNNTNLTSKYGSRKDGTLMLNVDDGNMYTSIGNKMFNISGSDTKPVVRIGNDVYNYVVIGNKKWITSNLRLFTPNRQYRFWDKPEFGLYYTLTDVDYVTTKLPTGWRIPTDSDIESLVSNGAVALQSKGFSSVWANATNSTGLSLVPSRYWSAPNETPNFSVAFIWGTKTTTEAHTLYVTSSSAARSGWVLSTAESKFLPIRVCADA